MIFVFIDVHKNGLADDMTHIATELGDITHRNKKMKTVESEEKRDVDEPLLNYCVKATIVSTNSSV